MKDFLCSCGEKVNYRLKMIIYKITLCH